MSNKIITMQKIKQIIKSSCSGWGSKKISSTSGVSRNTVKKYIHKFKELKISWEELSELTDNEVHELFIVNPAPLELSERYTTLQALLPSISKALMKKGSNMSLLWSEYIKKHPSGYQLSQYRAYLRQYLSRSSITMHFEHKAGDKMFVVLIYQKARTYSSPEVPELVKVTCHVLWATKHVSWERKCFMQTQTDYLPNLKWQKPTGLSLKRWQK
jgi:hypothetical protein